MKVLDKYVLKSFLSPFFATFLIVLFVLVMQALWQTFENIAGKGISIPFILKFLYYTTLIMTPQALPIGVLLSSIMALGNLGENYEFAAAKSAGISLQRFVRPLVFLAIGLSAINFLFLNNIYPYAVLKQRNLYMNIKKKKPALALVAGSFNADIPNYQIKFEEKYGEEKNLLKNVLIYDLSSQKGNLKIITAERGKIVSEEGSKYMTLILYDGHYNEEHVKSSRREVRKMPASSADFEEYTFNIDISSLSSDDLNEESFTTHYNMLTVQQLGDTIPKLKSYYDENIIGSTSKYLYTSIQANDLFKYQDSLRPKKVDSIVLNNFDLASKIAILNSSITKASRIINNFQQKERTYKITRKSINLYETEFYNRFAFSISCLILFFVGAPLGSIIRKGGFGLPMIFAICVYVIYFFGNTLGRNLAEESSVTSFMGAWISAIIMTPIAVLLTRRATNDKGIFNMDTFLHPLTKFLKKIKKISSKKKKDDT
jgi:lipopolysaccharide export system permease protein